jgi:Kinesin-like protein
MNSTENNDSPSIKLQYDDLNAEELLKIRAEASAVKKQFEVLRRTTQEELSQLPEYAKEWAIQASRALNVVQVEVDMLKNQLALEIANRRKLLHEVQDLRGNVRVYCRPLPMSNSSETANDKTSIVESPSHDTLVLRRDIALKKKGVMAKPMCFEFDHVFSPNATQSEVYAEMEELVLGTLEGFKTCLIAYGQTGSGKTRSMIGEFNISQGDGFGDDAIPAVDLNHLGIHLSAARQLFQVSSERKNIFEDTFTLSILEIQEEKLIDLVAGTDIAESTGVMNYTDGGSRRSTITSSESRSKLEIGTNHEGDTIVQGQVSVPVENFDDVITVWKQSLGQRAKMMQENGISFETNDQCRHLIATIEIISTNITTGIGTYGKLQCVDLAASDVTQKRGSNSGRSKGTGMDSVLASLEDNTEWKFLNKSINTLADVVDARVNFSRNPPYRNSTLTHVLRDALEADTKTLFLVCVKPESKDVQDAANSLRFASKIRKVVIGKATKRYLTVA